VPAAAKSARRVFKRPNPNGIPGRLVDPPPGANFGAHGRGSPYDALLTQLSTAKGKVLQFDSAGAKGSLYARARKLQMKLVFCEMGGKLYVKFDGWAPDSPAWKRLVRAAILDTVKAQPRNEIQVANELRQRGVTDVDAGLVGAILKQMEQEGLVLRQRDGSWNAR
jgi:hypothetical protein